MRDAATLTFGSLVRARRTAQGLSQEALAAAAFGNADRKTYVSALENGRLKRITPATAAKMAQALELHREDVPPGLQWAPAQPASPLEHRLDSLEAQLSETRRVPPALSVAAEFNAQLAQRLSVSVSEMYFQRLDRGLGVLTHFVGRPFSGRSLAVCFSLAFVYIILAGLLALGHGSQNIGEVTPFQVPSLPFGLNGFALAMGLIGFTFGAGLACNRLLRVIGAAQISHPLRGARIALAAALAGIACTLLARITGEPIAVALFFAVVCLGALAQLSSRDAALAGLGGGMLAGIGPGLAAQSDVVLTALEGLVIGGTIGAGAGLAASLAARRAPSVLAGQIAGGGAGVALGVVLVCAGLFLAQSYGGLLSGKTAILVVMWLSLPFANALVDWVSLGCSHWLAGYSSRKRTLGSASLLALVDFVLAAGLMLVTIRIVHASLLATDAVYGTDLQSAAFISASLRDLWGDGLWLVMMILSTVIWTYLHYACVVAPVFAGWMTHQTLERPAHARLSREAQVMEIEAAFVLPLRRVVFFVLWLALAALPVALLIVLEGGLQNYLQLACGAICDVSP